MDERTASEDGRIRVGDRVRPNRGGWALRVRGTVVEIDQAFGDIVRVCWDGDPKLPHPIFPRKLVVVTGEDGDVRRA